MTQSVKVPQFRAGYLPALTNIALVGLLVFWSRDPLLASAAGGATLAVGAVTGARSALTRAQAAAPPSLLEFLQAWLPGLVGLALGTAGLLLVVRNPGDPLLRSLGLALFVLQSAILAGMAVRRGGARQSA
jgi:hypothetical protein